MGNEMIVWVTTAMVLLAAKGHAQPIKCSTPNSLEGECIIEDDCPSILAIKNSNNLTNEDIAFLRRSQCDYEGFHPKVCCPVSTNQRTFELPKETPVRDLPNIDLGSRFKPDPGLPSLQICGRQGTDNRIFNGQITAIDEFPWMALLEYNTLQPSGNGFACGGALITDQHVLTAAHCLGAGEQQLGGLKTVRLGEHNINTDIDCDAIYIEDCADRPIDLRVINKVVHPNYDEDSIDQMHDIAILKLERPVQFTDFIKPICLSSKLPPAVHDPGHVQFVAGWGKTELGPPSPVKQKLKVPIVDETSCSSKYRPFHIKIGPRQLCAGGETSKDSCAGDSGGPLMVQAVSSKEGAVWYMTGIVSTGPTPCASNNIPGIYTKVFDYIDWIVENIRTM